MNRFHWRLVILLLAASPVFAGSITYDCDSSLSSAECTTLTTTIASTYNSLFTNATATILVQESDLSSDVADNIQFYNAVSYSSYYSKLKSGESGANDVAAVNSLGSCNGSCNNPVSGVSTIELTGPLEQALGLGTPTGICFLTASGCNTVSGVSTYGDCTVGVSDPNCYNDIISVGSDAVLNPGSGQYDFITAVEHETDEALGTASCIENTPSGTTPTSFCANSTSSAADLFRYSAPGTRSFLGTNGNQAEGSLAYFSINGGTTDIVQYNNTNNSADYGDFSSTYSCPSETHVQDAFGCPGQAGLTIANDGGAELALLDAVGYNLTTLGKQDDGELTPEPSSIIMVLAPIGAIAFHARRRVRANG